MRYRLRDVAPACKFSSSLTVEAISRAIPHTALTAAVQVSDVKEQRERKLTLVAVMFLLITMNLYPHLSLGAVWRKLVQGLRFIWPEPDLALITEPAITYRRYQLGARPMVTLFHHVCQPLATPQTQGAFLFGLRLMAIDGTVEDVADTPANVAACGRHPGPRGASAHPQVQCVYLAECGTHAIVDAGVWPCHVSERLGGKRLLRSVEPGMLVMWDRGFHEYDMIVGELHRQGQVLARLPAHVQPQRVRTLPDGSYLAYLFPSDYHRRKTGECVLVRIVEYTLTDPALPGHGERHRVVTTLLDHAVASAGEVACAYHERWEIEVVIDEVDTHQRLAARTLRSLKPVGVIQELYAVLLAHYAVRAVMHEAAVQAEVDPDRLSFVHAVRVLQDAIAEFQMVAPEQVPQLYQRLLRDIATEQVPERRLRCNPRVVKRKMSSFRLKRPEHARPRKPVGTFREAVLVMRAPPSPDDENYVLDLSKHDVQLHQSERCLI
jgi:hypothetical protein